MLVVEFVMIIVSHAMLYLFVNAKTVVIVMSQDREC